MDLYEKYNNKTLNSDDYAVARNEINEAVRKLEQIKITTKGEDHLLLKWGTLKSWKFHSEKGKKLLKEYFDLGSSASAMLQKDTDKQKEIICALIDECDGSIQKDWNGKSLTKKQAKEYVLGHN